jgi:hypothetical protein
MASAPKKRSRTIVDDVKTVGEFIGYKMRNSLTGRAADAIRQQQRREGQTTDSNNR